MAGAEQEQQRLPLDFQAQAQLFAEDVHNAVMDSCGDGLDAFYSCLASAPGVDEEFLSTVQAGTQQLYEDVAERMEAGLRLFEEACKATVLRAASAGGQQVAVLLPPPLPAVPSASGTPEAEDELEERLAGLRQRVAQADQNCSALRSQVELVDTQLASCGDQPELSALAATAVSSRHTIRAILHAATGLQNMLERAQRVRALSQLRGGGGGSDMLASLSTATPNTVPLEAVQAFAKLIGAS